MKYLQQPKEEIVCPKCGSKLKYYSRGSYKRWGTLNLRGELMLVEEELEPEAEYWICVLDPKHNVPWWLYNDVGELTGEVNEIGVKISIPRWAQFVSEEEYLKET
jgi:hypothetical protein